VDDFLRQPDAYFVVDVREPSEMPATHPITNITNIPLGALLRAAADRTLERNNKPVVCVCNIGYRGGVAAEALQALGVPAYVLQGGLQAVAAPLAAVFRPGFVVVLQTCDPEKATLALSVATAAQTNGRKTALVCMASAPLLFRRESVLPAASEPRAMALRVGDPFKDGKTLVEKFTEAGGKIFACKSCVQFHKLDYSQLEEVAWPLQAPDLVEMSSAAQGTVTFA
jgi:rhodanese-related sulfurtransferase/predicted peroxiredoxin